MFSDGAPAGAVDSAKQSNLKQFFYIFLGITFADVLEVGADALAVVDQRTFGVQVGAWSVREGFMVEMEELAVVLSALRRALVQERPAEEFVLDLAGQTARRLAGHLQLLVGVVMQRGVLGDLVVGDADAGRLEDAVPFARLVPFQAEVLEVVDSLGVNELDELARCTAIGVAQLAL